MRKLLTLPVLAATFFCLTFSSLHAQYVNIPDANFVNYLTQQFPACMNGSQMDTTCTSILQIQTLDVRHRNISDLTGVRHFDNLQTLRCFSNPLGTLPVLPPNLKVLTAYRCNFTSLGPLPGTLTYLRLDENNLTSLPPLPSTLIKLNIAANFFTVCPALPAGLEELWIDRNQLSTLPPLPTGLTFLFCGYNGASFTSLPPLPATLQTIDCSYNALTSLPTLPAGLAFLGCNYNDLTTLPPLPAGLTYLGASRNDSLVLPATLPPTLDRLDCEFINVTSLPPLPATLTDLYCRGLDMPLLPTLPAGLERLYCGFNSVITLPASLPSSLKHFSCSQSLLTSLPAPLPPALEFLNVQANLLTCLPLLPTTLSSVSILNNQFSCLPNYLPAMDAATISTFPLCVVGDPINNPSNCSNGVGVNGIAYLDNNTDCAFTPGESGIEYVPFRLYDNANTLLESTFSTGTGGYYFSPLAGNYTVEMDLSDLPYLQTACPTGSTSPIALTTAAPVQAGVDFDLECNGFDVGAQAVVPRGWVFPGQPHDLHVWAGDLSQFNGFSCANGVSGQVQFVINGPVAYVGPATGALTPVVAGNTYTYAISDFGLVNIRTDFGLQFTTNTTAVSGDSVCVSLAVTGGAGDVVPANNAFTQCYYVNNSYDPNEKQVYPEHVVPEYADWITYTLHFQNTGDAPAFNIQLEDTLDSKLDYTSFQLLGFSHDNVTTLKAGGLLIAQFPNIMLPDSTTDLEGSKGWIQFRIKPQPGLPAGTQILNTARIYFDFNDPIVTNTTKTSFDAVVSTTGLEAFEWTGKVYPNPGNGKYQLEWPAELAGEKIQVEVYDLEGQLLYHEEGIQVATYQLDIADQVSGIYVLQISTPGRVYHHKLMKTK